MHPTQARILTYLQKHPEATTTDLLKPTKLQSTQGINWALRILEEQGYIKREPARWVVVRTSKES